MDENTRINKELVSPKVLKFRRKLSTNCQSILSRHKDFIINLQSLTIKQGSIAVAI